MALSAPVLTTPHNQVFSRKCVMSNGNQKILTNVTIFTMLINISPRRSVTLYDAEQNREDFFWKTDKGKFSVTEVIGKYPIHG